MPLWIRAEVGGAVEWHERDGEDLTFGRNPVCSVRLAHRTVAPMHARLWVRRSRLLLLDLGSARRGTVVCGRRIGAPVVVEPGEAVGIGDVSLRLEHLDEVERGPAGAVLDVGRVGKEVEPSGPGLRRFELSGNRELVLAGPGVDAALWRERVGLAHRSVHLSTVQVWTSWRGRPALVEHVPPGARLSRLLAAETQGRVSAPLGARALIAAQLAAAVRERHGSGLAHGTITASSIHLSVDGRVVLLVPAPSPCAPDDPVASAARRHGGPVGFGDDRWALSRLGAQALRLEERRRLLEVLRRWAGTEGALEPGDVLEAVREEGLDPAPAALGRLVRVLLALEAGPVVLPSCA